MKNDGLGSVAFAREAILQVFSIIDKKCHDYAREEDSDALERLKTEVIPKYEKIWLALADEALDAQVDEGAFGTVATHIGAILQAHGLTEDFVRARMALRENHRNRSGAEVMKKLFQTQAEKLAEKKARLLGAAALLLTREEELNKRFADAIQEETQMKILEQLSPVRRRYLETEREILETEDKLKELRNKLEKKWYYEIFGTMAADALRLKAAGKPEKKSKQNTQ